MLPLPLIAAMIGGKKFAVTVSGEVIDSISSSYPVSGVRINADGTIDKVTGTYLSEVYTQIDAGTDWIIPNGEADAAFEVKIEEVSTGGSAGSPVYDSPAGDADKGLSTYFDMSEDRKWITRHNETNDTSIWTFTVHIRRSGGAVLDSGEYACTATEITV